MRSNKLVEQDWIFFYQDMFCQSERYLDLEQVSMYEHSLKNGPVVGNVIFRLSFGEISMFKRVGVFLNP